METNKVIEYKPGRDSTEFLPKFQNKKYSLKNDGIKKTKKALEKVHNAYGGSSMRMSQEVDSAENLE